MTRHTAKRLLLCALVVLAFDGSAAAAAPTHPRHRAHPAVCPTVPARHPTHAVRARAARARARCLAHRARKLAKPVASAPSLPSPDATTTPPPAEPAAVPAPADEGFTTTAAQPTTIATPPAGAAPDPSGTTPSFGPAYTGPMLWGAWMDTHRTGDTQPPWDMSVATQVEQAEGKSMSLLEFATPMSNGDEPYAFPTELMDRVRAHGSLPFFSWSTFDQTDQNNPDFTLKAIIAGKQDATIRAWAQGAKAWGHPFYLRFNWEMNGNWFPWGEEWNGNQPGDYIAAWRHVHDIFTQVGAHNASWVWCPTADPYNYLAPPQQSYPGSSYVDLTCIDAYNGYTPQASFSDVMQKVYGEVAALAPDKPMILGEVGSTEAGGSKADWITNMFASLPQFPLVRGIVWFDGTAVGPGGGSDWPLDSSPAATQAFAAGVAAPRWASATYAHATALPTG